MVYDHEMLTEFFLEKNSINNFKNIASRMCEWPGMIFGGLMISNLILMAGLAVKIKISFLWPFEVAFYLQPSFMSREVSFA